MCDSTSCDLPPPPVNILTPSGQDEMSLGNETPYVMPPHPSFVTTVPPPMHIIGLPFLSSSASQIVPPTTSTSFPNTHVYSTKTKNVQQFVTVPYRVSPVVTSEKALEPTPVVKSSSVKCLPPVLVTDCKDRGIGVGLICGSGNKNMDHCMICGYNHDKSVTHRYSYYDQVSNELICKICCRPLVDPLETRCGHTFCAMCLKSHLVVQALCPEDNQIINYLECSQASSIVKRLLDKLLINCPNGCDVILSRADLEAHLLNWCKGIMPRVDDSNRETSPQKSTNHNSPVYWGIGSDKSPRSKIDTPRFWNSQSTREETVLGSSPSSDSNIKNIRRVSGEVMRSPQKHLLKCSPAQKARKKYYSTNDENDGLLSIILDRSTELDLGISFVGGSDTPLQCIIIQEIYLDGLVAKDGRMRPGDQIVSINDIDLNEISHSMAKHAFLHAHREHGVSRVLVFRERSEESVFNGKEDILQFSLSKRADKKLGIKLVGQKNKPGLYVLDLVKGSEADLDGRLRKNDRIISINGIDLTMSTQDGAADVINIAEDDVRITISRTIRPQTPDLFHKIEFDQAVENLGKISPYKAVRVITSPTKKIVTVEKNCDESLGISIAGGANSQRGNVPIYITNLTQDGVLTKTQKVNKGDILISVNETELIGLSHEKAVEELKAVGQRCRKVTIHLVPGPETMKLGRHSFQPSWIYWLQLPKYCEMPRSITLRRDSNTMSLGFSIVGGIDCGQQLPAGRRCSMVEGRAAIPILIKSIVSGSVAYRSGQLKCGDILLKVNNISLASIAHEDAVTIFKNVHDEVTLLVVSWPGTIV